WLGIEDDSVRFRHIRLEREPRSGRELRDSVAHATIRVFGERQCSADEPCLPLNGGDEEGIGDAAAETNEHVMWRRHRTRCGVYGGGCRDRDRVHRALLTIVSERLSPSEA